jgi:hypothetical protein
MVEISRSEARRFLGYRGISEPDERVERILEECIQELQEKASPKEVHMTFPLEWEKGFCACSFAGIRVPDQLREREREAKQGCPVPPGGLLKNLKGCSEIVMLAVTIGPEADLLVRRAEIRDVLRAYAFQAAGAAYAEAWCDEVNERIRQEAAERGLYARPRFSPGYGDFPLEAQKDFSRILDMPKKIGVSLSESLLMTPTKSITAVIGLSKEKTDCHRAGCEECSMSGTCAFSRIDV